MRKYTEHQTYSHNEVNNIELYGIQESFRGYVPHSNTQTILNSETKITSDSTCEYEGFS